MENIEKKLRKENSNKSKNFIPTKDMWYIYFNFYTNSQNEINKFKDALKNKYDFILGFVEISGMFNSKKVVIYVSSEEEVKKIKNSYSTLKLYQKYVGKSGRKVF